MDSWLACLGWNLRYDGLWWRRLAHLGCVYGPEWWKRYSPPVIAAMIFLMVERNRRGATMNMHHILGTPSQARARRAALRMFAEFARCFVETEESYGPRPPSIQVEVSGRDELLASLRRGRGAVVVTGHFGNWDIAAKELREYGRPINLVMAHEANVSARDYVRRQTCEIAGLQLIYSDSSVFSSLNMIRALRRNEVVAMQLDRSLDPSGTCLLPFFGAPAAFPFGPFILARVAGAPLIPAFVPRLGRRHYAIRVCRAFTVAREGRAGHGLDHVMRQVVLEFEAIVREFPTQWFQFAPFWPTPAVPMAAAPVAASSAEALHAGQGRFYRSCLQR